jgi:hypothetical protein
LSLQLTMKIKLKKRKVSSLNTFFILYNYNEFGSVIVASKHCS